MEKDVRELDRMSDHDLRDLHTRIREAVERGDPMKADVERYGIRDLGALKLWTGDMERLLRERDLPFAPIPWDRTGAGG